MRVRKYISPISGEVVLLLDKAGMPLSFPNRYAYSVIEKRGGSLSSIKKALYVFSRIYLWADVRGVNLRQILYYGEFLTLDQVSDLADFIQFTSKSQNEILQHKHKFKKYPVDRSNIINFRNSNEVTYEYASNQVYANRLRALKKIFKWIVQERKAQRVDTPKSVDERLQNALDKIDCNIPRVRSRQDEEKFEAVDLDTIEQIAKVLHPEHLENPFSTPFIRHRNYLLLLLLIESGGRRQEIYNTRSKDIIASTLQFDIQVSKTVPRTLPVSMLLVEAFETFHSQYWRHLSGAGKKSGFLFVKSNGERMSLRAVNGVIETIRKSIPEVPAWFHTHTIRRTFNHRLSLLIDEKRKSGFEISHEEERKIRNRLNGWSLNSTTGEIYNSRHLREKADQLAERVLNDIEARV